MQRERRGGRVKVYSTRWPVKGILYSYTQACWVTYCAPKLQLAMLPRRSGLPISVRAVIRASEQEAGFCPAIFMEGILRSWSEDHVKMDCISKAYSGLGKFCRWQTRFHTEVYTICVGAKPSNALNTSPALLSMFDKSELLSELLHLPCTPTYATMKTKLEDLWEVQACWNIWYVQTSLLVF